LAVERDYYRVLAIKRGASGQEVKAAFRQLVMRYHPDHNPGREAWAGKRLQGIIQAYEVLGNPSSRRSYDARLAARSQARVVRQPARPARSSAQDIARIILWRGTPGWVKVALFGFMFLDFYVKESEKAK